MDTINNNSGIKPHESYPLVGQLGGEAVARMILDNMPDITATHFVYFTTSGDLFYFREGVGQYLEIFKDALGWSEVGRMEMDWLKNINQLREEVNALPFHIDQRIVFINCPAAEISKQIWNITDNNPADHMPITLNGEVSASYDHIRIATIEELDVGHRIDPLPPLQVGDDVVAIEKLTHKEWMGNIKFIEGDEAYFNNPDNGIPLSWLRKATPEESLTKARLDFKNKVHPFNAAANRIALAVGFKEQDQEDGSRDLPPHFYQFAFALGHYVKNQEYIRVLDSEIQGYKEVSDNMTIRWMAEVEKRRDLEQQLWAAQKENQQLKEERHNDI